MSEFDAIILGAGGAGLICAATAGQLGRKVLLLDHASKAGKKILISGGGRCNFTNLGAEPDCYLSQNPHFVKSALSRYSQWDFLDLVERYKIAWHEKTLGQLFCDGSARQIVAMLLEECARGDVTLRLGTKIGEIGHRDGRFEVAGARAPALVIATGGPSIPKMGASRIAYEIAQRFGLGVVTPRPGLVPLTVAGGFSALAGVALQVRASVGGARFEEAALFTHKGLSGPAILQVSSYWRAGAVTLDLLAAHPEGALGAAKRAQPRGHMRAALERLVPRRLAAHLAEALDETAALGTLPDAALDALEAQLRGWSIAPSGTEGYAKAEVTVGGIDTDALSSKTMEARRLPGLYAIGEAVDVTGWLGGYNFQWAWSSGVAAGQAIAARELAEKNRS